MPDLVRTTDRGLFCEAGGFYIDPWKPVEWAVVTHAHADHTRPGSRRYLTTTDGEPLVRRRTQKDAEIETLEYGEKIHVGDVTISLYPAGHVLGSAQILIEHEGERWVAAGDYKTDPDPTCKPFDPVPCDVFITESTFGLPIYEWQNDEQTVAEILAWWRQNQSEGRTSLICAYALGKAQRVIAGVGADAPGPIAVHGAVRTLNEGYEEAGIKLPETRYASPEVAKEIRGHGLVVAPPAANGSPWMRKFGDVTTAFCSGWMRLRGPRRRRNFDHGFVMSDHADWNGLLGAIDATGAERVLVTHGSIDPLVRYLREEKSLRAEPLATAFVGEPDSDDQPVDPEDQVEANPVDEST